MMRGRQDTRAAAADHELDSLGALHSIRIDFKRNVAEGRLTSQPQHHRGVPCR